MQYAPIFAMTYNQAHYVIAKNEAIRKSAVGATPDFDTFIFIIL